MLIEFYGAKPKLPHVGKGNQKTVTETKVFTAFSALEGLPFSQTQYKLEWGFLNLNH